MKHIHSVLETFVLTYIGLIFIEFMFPNSVTAYFDPTIVLGISFILAIISLFTKQTKEPFVFKKSDYIYIVTLSAITFFVVKGSTTGSVSWIVSLFAALSASIISILVMKKEVTVSIQKYQYYISVFVAVGVFISLPLFTTLSLLETLRILAGIFIVFFLPGYIWAATLFENISQYERIALSFGLSIGAITLIAFLGTFVSIPINIYTIGIVTLVLIASGLILMRKKIDRHSQDQVVKAFKK